MKLSIVIACILGAALAAPQSRPAGRPQQQFRTEGDVQVLKSDISEIDGANFRYLYELDNGIFAEKVGTAGSKGQSNFVGSYRFQTPEGEIIEVRYVADENGFLPESASIPVAPPLPPHALEQIRIGEQQRAQGIRFDDRGFQI